MQLHFDVHDGRGPALLLVHGALTSREQWRPNLAALSECVRPVVVELWGHGRSPSPEDDASYHPNAYVKCFEALRTQLGEDRWIVCGQSLGAALTLRYALDHPERLLGHVFTNSMSAMADAEWIASMQSNARARAAEIEREGRTGIEQIPVHPLYVKRIPAELKAALVRDSTLLHPRGVAGTLCHTTAGSSVRERIGENRVPTLLVCGEREKRFAPHRAYAEANLPHLQTVGVDAGHAANLQAPDAFNVAVARFVKGVA